eukprot:4548691-Amphidinium_carterae.1
MLKQYCMRIVTPIVLGSISVMSRAGVGCRSAILLHRPLLDVSTCMGRPTSKHAEAKLNGGLHVKVCHWSTCSELRHDLYIVIVT